MKIKLTEDERILILQSVKIAQYFYEKLNRVKDAAEAKRLFNLMFCVDSIRVETRGEESLPDGELENILALRDNILKRGNVVDYPTAESGISDFDDPGEIKADRDFARIAKEWLRDKDDD